MRTFIYVSNKNDVLSHFGIMLNNLTVVTMFCLHPRLLYYSRISQICQLL